MNKPTLGSKQDFINRVKNNQPMWPHDAKPPVMPGDARPKLYVMEMTAVGVLLNTGPDAVIRAVRDRLSPSEFATQQNGIIIYQSALNARDPD